MLIKKEIACKMNVYLTIIMNSIGPMNDHIIPLLVDSQQLNTIIINYNHIKDLLIISTIKIILYSSRYTNNDNR